MIEKEKRNILISAKSSEEFKEIEDALDLLDENFVKKFSAVCGSPFYGKSLILSKENATEECFVIPEGSSNIYIDFSEEDKKYKANLNCKLIINEEEYTISIRVSGYGNINKVKSMNILKS